MNTPAVAFSKVEYAYPDGTKALDGVSFSVEEKEKVGIIGPNGAGKSTLLFHLNGLLTPQSGSVFIEGVEAVKKNLPLIRRRVGVVFQNPDDQLFCPTVFEDIAFGPRNQGLPEDEVDRRVREALAWVGLEGFEKRSAHHLSFGQKKKVAIATVLSMRPAVWAFDEPSANLDPASQSAVEDFIAECRDTVLVVTQDLFFAAEVCDRLVIMKDGRIVLDGSAEDILRKTEDLKRLGLGFERHCRICKKIHEPV